MAKGRSTDNESESRRIIARVAGESEAGGIVQRTARRAQDHLTAADTDPDDRIEQWGTRIGRAIAVLITIGVIAWAVLYLAQM